ncbi:MAG: YdeI/OmpD-associated family protein [Chloroflexota bacterium]
MEQTFQTTVKKQGSKFFIQIPFDPDTVWGEKQRHYVHGLIHDCRIRALIKEDSHGFVISLGAAWRRDNGIDAGDNVAVVLEPEGPQLATMADDIVAALKPEPAAIDFFNSLATHYRKNYVRWIEEAKRPETRANRIQEMVELLKAGKQAK